MTLFYMVIVEDPGTVICGSVVVDATTQGLRILCFPGPPTAIDVGDVSVLAVSRREAWRGRVAGGRAGGRQGGLPAMRARGVGGVRADE